MAKMIMLPWCLANTIKTETFFRMTIVIEDEIHKHTLTKVFISLKKLVFLQFVHFLIFYNNSIYVNL